MLHQRIANCVLYTVYSEFLGPFPLKQLSAAAQNNTIRAVRVNQDSKDKGWWSRQ